MKAKKGKNGCLKANGRLKKGFRWVKGKKKACVYAKGKAQRAKKVYGKRRRAYPKFKSEAEGWKPWATYGSTLPAEPVEIASKAIDGLRRRRRRRK